jgi:putative Ca2+/H+ antiporter (TMEM165/GDT1 family)
MNISVAAVSFGLVFLMELADKTQLLILSLSARTGWAWAVFAGATLALTAVTLAGVAAGSIIGTFIPLAWLARLAGLAFIAIGAFILWSSRPGTPDDRPGREGNRPPGWTARPLGTLAVTFGLLVVAEMGDKSQLAVVGLAAKSDSPLSVFVGASIALTLVTGLAVLTGTAVTRVVPAHWISRGAALLFILIGLLTLAGLF